MSTRLRGNKPQRKGPYPLGAIPRPTIVAIGKKIVHRLAAGNADISGDDFGNIFASAVGGEHRRSPLGIADVGLDNCAWSIKTIKTSFPFRKVDVRLISGRNSPVYAEGINNPFADIQQTGAAVLNVWNARVNEAYGEYAHLRIVLLVRNVASLEFLLTEYEAHLYNPLDFIWELRNERNWVGRDASGAHVFTWQSHGAQFTIHHRITPSAQRFRILRQPPTLTEESVLESIGFEDSWIEVV